MRTSTSSELSDGELMMQLGHGDNQALGEIYLRYASVVRTALTRSAPELPRAQRDELTQDVFLSLLELARPESERRYRDEERLKAFLYGVSVRKARMWRRQTWLRRHLLQRHADRPVAMAQALEGGGSPANRTEARQAVARALSRLPEAQREVLLLHAEGFSGDEIAHQLKIRPKTVWTRLHRARSTLLAVALLGLSVWAIYGSGHGRKPGVAVRTLPAPRAAGDMDMVSKRASHAPTPVQLSRQTVASEVRTPAEAEVSTPALADSSRAKANALPTHGMRTGRLTVHAAASEREGPRVLETARQRKLLGPEGHDALDRLRRAVLEGRLSEAELGLRAYLTHSGRDAAAWSLLGDCLRKQGKWRESVEAYRTVIHVGAAGAENRARFLAASVLQDRLNDPRAVIALLEGYGRDQLTSPEARLRLARALIDVGESKRARGILEAVLASRPASSITHEARRMLAEPRRTQP